MKNEFKKKDANGNKLPEQSGKGLNKEHWEEVKKARESKTSLIAYKDTPTRERQLQDYAKSLGFNDYAPVLRTVMGRFLDSEIDPIKLNFITQELSLKDDRIVSLEYCLEQLKSQLLDTHKEDSVIITTINNGLKQ